MLARINTIAFNGLKTLDVDLQLQITSGMPFFGIVGLPDKTIGESKERVRAALNSLGVELPAKRILINLAPADLLKEGSHFDLPIAVALLAGLGIIPLEEVENYLIVGELGLLYCGYCSSSLSSFKSISSNSKSDISGASST